MRDYPKVKHFPVSMRVSPALAADLIAATVAFAGAFASHGSARTGSIGGGVALLLVAMVRFGARPPLGFIVDEAAKELVIGTRRVPLADVAVGPRRSDGRWFRLYVLTERVRTYEVRADTVVGAPALHSTLEALGAKVTVVHAERHDFAAAVSRIVPVTLGLCGLALVGRAMALWSVDPLALGLFGGMALCFGLADAVGVAGPPLIVDAARRRVYWKRWVPLADVRIEPPRISNLSAPDLVLDVGGWRVRLGVAWTPVAPLKAELVRLGVGVRSIG